MIPEIGHSALWLALIFSLLSALLPLSLRRAPHWVGLVSPFSYTLFGLISAAFAVLIYSYAVSDFSVLNVVLNSHSEKPLLFKITGTWGNHEGSMLLWVWILAFYGAMITYRRSDDEALKRLTLAVHGLVMSGFLAFILFTSNPFERVYPPALEGEDLNPLLQDIGLAFHPPMLYLGYVGFGIVFSYAIAAMLRGKIDSVWARETQPWVLMAWSTLTLGIALGGWWAYRELGWGGWWFWDPVENVSLLPWFAGTALMHSNLVLERRNQLGGWVLLLAIVCFTMSLIGTFIVRSGLVMSVHSFASDPLRGNIILLYIALVVGAALLLYATKRVGSPPATIHISSRVGGILINNVFLLALTGTILLSILAPLVLTLLKLPTITVGAPYFNTIFFPLSAPLIILAGLGPLVPWQRIGWSEWWKYISPLAMFAAAAALVMLMIADSHLLLAMLAAAFTSWLASATLWQAVRRYRAIAPVVGEHWLKRMKRFPLQQAGTLVSHFGLALLCGAIALTSLARDRFEATIPPSGLLTFGAYTLRASDATQEHRHNYQAVRVGFDVEKHGKPLAHLAPEIRYYPARKMETSEVAIDSNLWRDVYLVIGRQNAEAEAKPSVGVRLYVTPGMALLWLGFGLIAGGGMLSLLGRLRQRRGAGAL